MQITAAVHTADQIKKYKPPKAIYAPEFKPIKPVSSKLSLPPSDELKEQLESTVDIMNSGLSLSL